MVLFYHKRMLETFADGIYFDDYFLVPNYNPLGPGYVDDEGKLQPGVNIFGFHDLTKRMAVMQHQMGRRPLVFLHMTNTNIVPMLSFGTMIFDHEWRDQGDFQTRIPRSGFTWTTTPVCCWPRAPACKAAAWACSTTCSTATSG